MSFCCYLNNFPPSVPSSVTTEDSHLPHSLSESPFFPPLVFVFPPLSSSFSPSLCQICQPWTYRPNTFIPLVHLLHCIKYTSAFERSAGEGWGQIRRSLFVGDERWGFDCCLHYWEKGSASCTRAPLRMLKDLHMNLMQTPCFDAVLRFATTCSRHRNKITNMTVNSVQK